MTGIPAQHVRPSLAEQPLYASSGDRYAEVFLRPRAEMGLLEVFVLRWRDVPDADGLAQPIREALTADLGWAEVAPGCEAHRYDSIVLGRAGVTVDIDLLAGVIERARAQIDSLATTTYDVVGEPLVPTAITDRLVADLERPTLIEGLPIDVDDRMPPNTFAVTSGDPTHPERGGDAVVVDLDHPPVKYGGAHLMSKEQFDRRPVLPAEEDRPAGVVRPVGLTWAGIRVDELERIGYEVLGPVESCPVKLYSGEIFGEPATGRIYVWSRTDFDLLVALSRRLYDARRRRPLDATSLLLTDERRAAELAESGAESILVVRALPAPPEPPA
jgi:hypothetical protein